MDRWIEMTIICDRDFLPHLTGLLMSQNIKTWAEEEDNNQIRLKVYLPYYKELMKNVESLKKLLEVEKVKVLTAEIDDENWAVSWQRFFNVEHIGRDIVIKPPWEDYSPKEGEIVLEIEPRDAFGSGFHPTTKLTLILAREKIKPQMRIMDMGCGSGILTLLALHLQAESVSALDLDPIAVRETLRNVNETFAGCPQMIEKAIVELSDGFEKIGGSDRFDLMMININTGFLMDNMNEAFSYMKPGGFLITGSVELEQEAQFKKITEELGIEIVENMNMDGWSGFVLQKT